MSALFSLTEAAAAHGCSVSHLRELCAQGRVQGAIRIGHRWAVPAPVAILPPARPRGRPAKV